MLDSPSRAARLKVALGGLERFKGKIEEESRDGVDFLDFRIVKGPFFNDTGFFDIVPLLRNKGPVLANASTHPVGIHVEWPLQYIRSLWFRSSALSAFTSARDSVMARLRENFYDEEFVELPSE